MSDKALVSIYKISGEDMPADVVYSWMIYEKIYAVDYYQIAPKSIAFTALMNLSIDEFAVVKQIVEQFKKSNVDAGGIIISIKSERDMYQKTHYFATVYDNTVIDNGMVYITTENNK